VPNPLNIMQNKCRGTQFGKGVPRSKVLEEGAEKPKHNNDLSNSRGIADYD